MRALYSLVFLIVTEAKAADISGGRYDALMRRDRFDTDENIMPVPFGHIRKEGFGYTSLGHKTPIDLLDLSMKSPRNYKEAVFLLENADPSTIHIYTDPPELKRPRIPYHSPRDRIVEKLRIRNLPPVNETFRWLPLSDLLERNFVQPAGRTHNTGIQPEPRIPAPRPLYQYSGPPSPGFIGDVPYGDLFKPPKKEHFTTCDEFGVKAYFYPNDIINLIWVPFYVWSNERRVTALPHTFTYATKKFVNTYRERYRKQKWIIDWQKTKFIMKGRGEFLLIAADKKGLFHALQVVDPPENWEELNITFPYTTIRLKIVDPYLAVMFCDMHYVMIMAVEGNEPKTDKDKEEEAATLGIHGPGRPVYRDLKEEKRMKHLVESMEKIKNKASTPSYGITPEILGGGQPF